MKNELLQLGLKLNVICLEHLKLIIILKPKSTMVGSETGRPTLRKIRISSETPLSITPNSCIRTGILCLESIFWEQPYFETKEVHTMYNEVLCANSNFNKKF